MEHIHEALCPPLVGLARLCIRERVHCKVVHDPDLRIGFVQCLPILGEELLRHFNLIDDQVVSVWCADRCEWLVSATVIAEVLFLNK